MTICFVLDDTLDVPDGVQQYVLTIGNWLSHQGHEVHYIAPQTLRKDIPNLHSLGRIIATRFNGNTVRTPSVVNQKSVKRILSKINPDVLHIQLPCSPFLAGRIINAAPKATALIGTFHILPYSRRAEIGAQLLGIAMRRTMKKLDAVVSVSRPAQLFASKRLGLQSTIVPNAVNIAHFKASQPKAKLKRIVFLGRLVPRKGCKYLLQAIKKLHDNKVTNFEVVVAGAGPEQDRLKEFCQHAGIDHIVKFTGYIQERDKPALLVSADIAVFPSTAGESFGIVLIEAMASGAVVLAGDNPGYRSVMEALPDQLVDVQDTKLFAQKLKRFLEATSETKSVISQQNELLKQYSDDTVGAQLEQLYNDVLQSKGRVT